MRSYFFTKGLIQIFVFFYMCFRFFYIIVFVLNINERIPHTTRRDRRVACVLHGPGSNPGLFHFCISLYVECLEIFLCVVWFGAFLFSSIF